MPLGGLIFVIARPFLKKDISIIQKNLRITGRFEEQNFDTFAKSVFVSQFAHALDTQRFLRDSAPFEIEDWQECVNQFSRFKESQSHKGLIVITAHIGSWDLAGHFAAKAMKQVGLGDFFVLAKPSKTRWIDPLLERLRVRLGMKVLWTGGKSILKDMMKTLTQGHALGFVMDQRPEIHGSGHQLKFLGVESTDVVRGTGTMATRFDVGVMSIYCVRIGVNQMKLITRIVLPSGHGIKDESILTQQLVADLESAIVSHPTAWAWNYRRWKKHPAYESLSKG